MSISSSYLISKVKVKLSWSTAVRSTCKTRAAPSFPVHLARYLKYGIRNCGRQIGKYMCHNNINSIIYCYGMIFKRKLQSLQNSSFNSAAL